MRFLSHPGKFLEQHLIEVANESRRILDHPALKEREFLRELGFFTGLAHDFGKFTTFFQAHLKKEHVSRRLSQHSMISAFFAAYLVRKHFPDHREAPLLAYLAVHRHHGYLRIPEQTFPREENEWDILRKQWENLQEHREEIRATFSRIYSKADEGFLGYSFEQIEIFVRELRYLFRELLRSLRRKTLHSEELGPETGRLALRIQLLFSALISADKFAASGIDRPKRENLEPSLVDSYLANKKAGLNPIDQLRSLLQEKVWNRAEKEKIPGLFTLTAPTGSGKTLTAFKAALIWRKRLKKIWGTPPRIIYALPFINLIEQVEEVLREVLTFHPRYERFSGRFLIAHHHLAKVRYQDEEEKPLREALMLVEGWESEVIITTFVQVFHTIFGYENRMLKKMHNLLGSILILDEPQQFPPEYWKALGWIFSLLQQELGVTILIMTATQPRLMEKIKTVELSPENYIFLFFKKIKRIKAEEVLENDNLFELIKKGVSQGKSQLIVVNTIRTSLEMWEKIREQFSDVRRWYLSTNIVPFHRRKRIKEIHDALGDGPFLVVSTQVIEAGVDLDFDRVFREISPLDSFVQAAGRCNREGKQDRGEVFRFSLKESLLRGSYVYGRVALEVVREVWKGEVLDDERLYQRLGDYFSLLLKRISQEKSVELWEAYCHLRFSDRTGFYETLGDYPLIAYRDEMSVLVMLSPEDEERLEQFYKEVYEEKDLNKKQESYLIHRQWLYDRMLKILGIRARQNLPPEWKESKFRWVPFRQLKEYYSEHIGYLWRKEDLEQEIWIL